MNRRLASSFQFGRIFILTKRQLSIDVTATAPVDFDAFLISVWTLISEILFGELHDVYILRKSILKVSNEARCLI